MATHFVGTYYININHTFNQKHNQILLVPCGRSRRRGCITQAYPRSSILLYIPYELNTMGSKEARNQRKAMCLRSRNSCGPLTVRSQFDDDCRSSQQGKVAMSTAPPLVPQGDHFASAVAETRWLRATQPLGSPWGTGGGGGISAHAQFSSKNGVNRRSSLSSRQYHPFQICIFPKQIRRRASVGSVTRTCTDLQPAATRSARRRRRRRRPARGLAGGSYVRSTVNLTAPRDDRIQNKRARRTRSTEHDAADGRHMCAPDGARRPRWRGGYYQLNTIHHCHLPRGSRAIHSLHCEF